MLEMLVPPTEITGIREKRETTGELMATLMMFSTICFDSTKQLFAASGPASTLTSICNLKLQ